MYVCNGQFDDCNGDNTALKGLVVVPLGGYGAELGPGRVTVSQGEKQAALDFTVVGEPDTIKIDTFKSTISNGIKDIRTQAPDRSPPDLKLSGPDECPLPVTLQGFQDALGRPDKTVLIGRIYDSTGQQITQGWVSWTGHGRQSRAGRGRKPIIPIGPIAQFGAPITPTVEPWLLRLRRAAGALRYAGHRHRDRQGDDHQVRERHHVRPACRSDGAHADSFTLDFNVTSQVASVSATADPAVIDCNGTNSAKVSAAVVNAEGQPMPTVRASKFDVVALGTANPIISKTGGGVATTVVTPMSPTDELRGVTVNIKTIPSNTSAEVHETSVRVDCSGASVPAAGARRRGCRRRGGGGRSVVGAHWFDSRTGHGLGRPARRCAHAELVAGAGAGGSGVRAGRGAVRDETALSPGDA